MTLSPPDLTSSHDQRDTSYITSDINGFRALRREIRSVPRVPRF